MITLFLSIVYNFYNKRSYTKRESYPLENTITTFQNQHRILHFLQENFKIAAEERGLETVDLNLFGLPRLIFTNNIENVEYVLKTNFKNYGKGPILYRRFKGIAIIIIIITLVIMIIIVIKRTIWQWNF